ncbi:MAG: hypothetical protein ABW022_26465 [Actinoplanes sp.]
MSETMSLEQVSDLFRAVFAGLRVGSVHQDRAYSLEEVAQRTGLAVTSLVKECRAGRLEHVHKGDFRGMTPLQVSKMLEKYSCTGESSAAKDDIAQARAQSARTANRRTPRRAA